MKKLLFILNPKAGMKRANKYLSDMISVFNRAGYQTDVFVTGERGEAAQVAARRADSNDLVVCCGGDGTFNETVSGLLAGEHSVPLGYIPAGSTNDFASSLKLETHPVKAAKAIVEGAPHLYDMGQFSDRYFSYVASFGAFTRASYATPQNIKNALGHLAYVMEGIQELSQLKPIHVALTLDGIELEDDFLFGAVCNSTSVGGILKLDPKQVNLSDGLFEVLLVRMPKDLADLHECLWAVQKQEYNCNAITFCSAATITVKASPELNWALDGEWAPGAETITIRNLHQALTLIK